MIRRPPRSPLFPSPPLFRSHHNDNRAAVRHVRRNEGERIFGRNLAANGNSRDAQILPRAIVALDQYADRVASILLAELARRDRKSTRLNSSHLVISYAVFCL